MRILFNLFAITLTVLGLWVPEVYSQSESQTTAFSKAAKFDDVNEVRSLLTQGVSPNTIDSKGTPMLILAIKDKSNGVINLLLSDKRTDVDLSNKFGETPLMIASIEGDLPLVKTLVKQKHAMVDHIGWTPLHYACTKGNLEIAQYLLENGATVDSKSLNGTTPLMMAVQSGNEQLVKLLLDKGADLQTKNNLGLTAIDIADIYEKPWISEGLKARWIKLYKKPYIGPVKPIQPQS